MTKPSLSHCCDKQANRCDMKFLDEYVHRKSRVIYCRVQYIAWNFTARMIDGCLFY